MERNVVLSKNIRATYVDRGNGCHFAIVEDKRVNRDHDCIIEGIKKGGEKNIEKKARSLLNEALVHTMVEMRRNETYSPEDDIEREYNIRQSIKIMRAKEFTEMYLSKTTLERFFFDTAYKCMKENSKKNEEERIVLYAEQIHSFMSFLLKKKPCKDINSAISLTIVEEIIRPIAMGKMSSDIFPYFLLFCVMIVILPEKYILSMFDNARRKEKRKKVIMAKEEIGHLYDYEYVLNHGYVVDKVTEMRKDIFDLYFCMIKFFGNFVIAELHNQKNRCGEQESTHQQLETVVLKENDIKLDGYMYLYEAYMEPEHYWARNNFNSMCKILKRYVKYIVDVMNSPDGSGEKRIIVQGERNRTKVDKYRTVLLQDMMDFLEMDEECFYKTKTNEYTKKNIHIILDYITQNHISGKKFPDLFSEISCNLQQKKDYVTAMKFVDCMLMFLVGCYEKKLIPDLFDRYCDTMTRRYLNAYIQSAACDELEMTLDELIPYYKIYEHEFRSKVDGNIRELLEDEDVVEMVSFAIVEYVWNHLQHEYDDSILVKDAFSEDEVGVLITEKDILRVRDKLLKEKSNCMWGYLYNNGFPKVFLLLLLVVILYLMQYVVLSWYITSVCPTHFIYVWGNYLYYCLRQIVFNCAFLKRSMGFYAHTAFPIIKNYL